MPTGASMRWRSAGSPERGARAGRRARVWRLPAAIRAGWACARAADVAAAPVPQVQAQPLAGPTVGETLGTGPVRVGLILPLTQNGAPSAVGASLRNAAQLAIEESGMNDITLMIEDDHGTPDGAAQAAQAGHRRGRARSSSGRCSPPTCARSARVAKPAGRPVIAFSTDESVASPGVYLLSFLIESYADRIAEFAVSRGKKSFAVLAPQSDYANVAVGEFQQAAARLSARVVDRRALHAGQPQSRRAGDRRRRQADRRAVHPRTGGRHAGGRARRWPRAASRRRFSAPASGTIRACCGCRRCRAPGSPRPTTPASTPSPSATRPSSTPIRCGSPRSPTTPSRWRRRWRARQGAQRYSQTVLTNPSGFNGVDGVFRFRADGPNERGLAVMQISGGAATVVEPGAAKLAGS